MTAHEFNKRHPVGTKVKYYPVKKADGTFDPAYPPLVTKTRTEAWALDHGDVVVAIEGKSGGVYIEHLTINEVMDDSGCTAEIAVA